MKKSTETILVLGALYYLYRRYREQQMLQQFKDDASGFVKSIPTPGVPFSWLNIL